MIISVITPSFNQGDFIAETIESVLSQGGEFELDYIVVDGGSADGSREIIERFGELLMGGQWPVKCRGISYRWVSEKDRGQTDALMKGFRMARGTILAWLCSDDTYLPGALQAAAEEFHAAPQTALLYGDAHYCDAEGAVIGRYPTEEFDLSRLACFNFICQPSTFFRREAFLEVGGLDETLHFAMDCDLWIRLGKRFLCRHVPHLFSTYRLHEASKTMRDEDLLANHNEAVQLALSHFGWAPLTLVYGACNYYLRGRLPEWVERRRIPLICATLLCAALRSLWLNRGIDARDFKLLTPANLRKTLKSRQEILLGGG